MLNANTALLKVQGFFITSINFSPEGVILTIKRRRKTATCPSCQKRTGKLKDYRPRQTVLHLFFPLVPERQLLPKTMLWRG